MKQMKASIKDFKFFWDYQIDHASFTAADQDAPFWEGCLLPSFHLLTDESVYFDSTVTAVKAVSTNQWDISFEIGDVGSGSVLFKLSDKGIFLHDLAVTWKRDTSIIAMYFGTRQLTAQQLAIAGSKDEPFWPCLQSHEYCVPCAGGSPTHSFWRSWDMGYSVLPLGSYGAIMGTPYAAAYPRPLYAFAMGKGTSWIAAGPGEIPDAALSLLNKAGSGCLEYLYREDLWGAAHPRKRQWNKPLHIAIGKSAYEAYQTLFDGFNVAPAERIQHLKSVYCTWGQFMKGHFDLRAAADYAADHMPSDVVLIDDSWESFTGSGQADFDLFPDFAADLQYIRDKGMDIGLWLSLGWVHNPSIFGLEDGDLLCGHDGNPRKMGWLQNPYMADNKLFYCIDPSSEKARRFLRERSKDIVRKYDISLLKLDFGYGLPGPDICSPRDPSMRGEKLCHTLLEIVGQAAKEVKPEITIMYYGISPFVSDVIDLISLDDMGDCGESPEYERAGHSQRCLWASLAAAQGMPLNASSGYFWGSMDDILLDTFVVGASGTVLPRMDGRKKSITPYMERRWSAVRQWGRAHTSRWSPLLLDCDMGGSGSEPYLRSWARLEERDGKQLICAASLRGDSSKLTAFESLPGIEFSGKWAIVSLDEKDIYTCERLAIVPFSSGQLKIKGIFKQVQIQNSDNKLTAINNPADNQLTLAAGLEALDNIIGYVLQR